MPRYVVIRSNLAGVHFGRLVRDRDGQRVLRDARRAWSWKGALSCSELAVTGPGEGSRICVTVPRVTLTIATGDEMTDCTPEAVARWQAASVATS